MNDSYFQNIAHTSHQAYAILWILHEGPDFRVIPSPQVNWPETGDCVLYSRLRWVSGRANLDCIWCMYTMLD